MDTIERVKDWVESNGEYDRESHTWADSINPYRLKEFLSSLASERCVWEVKLTTDIDYLSIACDKQKGLERKEPFTNFKYCPYCGKQIVVKEEGNG